MFELPQEKRIRREDLHSESPSPRSSAPDIALSTLLRERFEWTYQPAKPDLSALPEPPALENTIEAPAEEEEEEGFSFRLFSTSTAKRSGSAGLQPNPQKIVIKSPSPSLSEPGFTHPRRPARYYFTGASSPSKRQQYEAAAISGQDVLNAQNTPYPGHSLPWRVLTLTLPLPLPPPRPTNPPPQPPRTNATAKSGASPSAETSRCKPRTRRPAPRAKRKRRWRSGRSGRSGIGRRR
ncbi:MAG: hypothetical protein FRX48_02967 [Lasallia pustulata]|uniref:Uncharacterized protein n=1 Tax=Lasallia pustulata TaxID=136370 RepID=A0A5M8PX20_9LECA|nr:MAG: hypothetical protein FRX48_02967 [Lasallia pustulata]